MMGGLWRYLGGVFGLCLLVAGGAQAGGGAGSSASAVISDGRALVRRVQEACQKRSFTGTFVVSAGGQMSSSQITRYCDAQQQIERVEPLDGPPRQIYRHNETVHVLWPRAHQALVEQGSVVHEFPGAVTPQVGNPLELYEVVPGTDERVAGFDAQVMLLRPRDAWRFAQRWWLERDSGLLLRADMLGEKGEVLESAAFSALQLGVRIQPQALLQEMNRLDGYRVQRPVQQPTDLAREGWTLRMAVPGFHPVSCVRRPGSGSGSGPMRHGPVASAPAALMASGVAGVGGGGEASSVIQAIYSDGLTHVSVFLEPYPGPRQEVQLAFGATHAVTRRIGDWWITVVGDVPPVTLRQFAGGLERRRP